MIIKIPYGKESIKLNITNKNILDVISEENKSFSLDEDKKRLKVEDLVLYFL